MDFCEFHSVPIFARYILSFLPNMSTASTATTSVACSHIPGDETELLNQMCVLVLTRGDCTPFNTTSIQEEDIIDLCVEMGQTHPEGVLWFWWLNQSFCFVLVMKCWLQHVESSKSWFCMKNPLGFVLLPPTTHLRAYIAVRDRKTSGT